MNDVLKLEIQTICVVHIFAIVLSIAFLMIFLIKARKNQALNWFVVVQLSMIGWMIFKIFKTVAPNVTLRWLFIVAYYICACILEIAFLEFGYTYYTQKSLKRPVRMLLWTVVVFQVLIIVTNPIHHLFYKTYNFWTDSFGILFVLHTVIEYAFIGVGFYYCRKMFKICFEGKNAMYRLLVSSAILLPLFINVLFITKVIHRFVFSLGWYVIFDLTPIVFTWSMFVFVYATFKSEFMSLSPILRHEIVHKLDTPILVLNKKFETLYQNHAYQSKDICKPDDLKEYLITSKTPDVIELKHNKRYIRVQSSWVQDQIILIFKDITPYKVIESELQNKQVELNQKNKILSDHIGLLKESSKIGARNYVARELHDIVGHSLVVTIKLLEVSKVYYNNDRTLSMNALKDVSDSLDAGLLSMSHIRKGQISRAYSGNLLKKELNRILDAIRYTGIQTKLSVKGLEKEIDDKVYDIIKKIAKELITNALKHSGAKEIFVSVKVQVNDLQMMIIDNGEGCDELIEGNGLKGIRSRLDLVNGNLDYITSKGEGFFSKISIKTS
ncbi:hypothetical protein EZV73_02980 [Acidaminobacter sp. JC074]|uniref:sensor histidine kinase n=1 Tax=Acidaminobacter sp. JC074 TaxID=2530199 RepID=UPI001F1191DA|nr:histidine kinase N-terminal 7TM domain-containing protein [Acidaminobacter sp. JC074]MCH4886512.1 hypothetical protein [Acidaminobacter sp. JC074]